MEDCIIFTGRYGVFLRIHRRNKEYSMVQTAITKGLSLSDCWIVPYLHMDVLEYPVRMVY